MRDILLGVAMIVIGLIVGNSIFLGHISLLSVIFDGLGIAWIILGIVRLNKKKNNPD